MDFHTRLYSKLSILTIRLFSALLSRLRNIISISLRYYVKGCDSVTVFSLLLLLMCSCCYQCYYRIRFFIFFYCYCTIFDIIVIIFIVQLSLLLLLFYCTFFFINNNNFLKYILPLLEFLLLQYCYVCC